MSTVVTQERRIRLAIRSLHDYHSPRLATRHHCGFVSLANRKELKIFNECCPCITLKPAVNICVRASFYYPLPQHNLAYSLQ